MTVDVTLLAFEALVMFILLLTPWLGISGTGNIKKIDKGYNFVEKDLRKLQYERCPGHMFGGLG